MSNFLRLVGENIRALRKEKGLTQEELAERCDLQHSYIGGIERGERNISLLTLEKLKNGLNVSTVTIFQFEKLNIEDTYNNINELLEIHQNELLNLNIDEIKAIHRITKEIIKLKKIN